MNIFESLRRDHYPQPDSARGSTQIHGGFPSRDELLQGVRGEPERHTAAEEYCFYVPLMEHDMTQEKARHSVVENHEIDELIEALEATEYSSTGWPATAKQLAHHVHHHFDEEEHEAFQLAGKVLSEELKVSLSEEPRREHWRIVNRLREHYLEQGKLPVAKQIRHRLDLEQGCVGPCFGDPRRAWPGAGLPDPGEEAGAYIETAEQRGPAD